MRIYLYSYGELLGAEEIFWECRYGTWTRTEESTPPEHKTCGEYASEEDRKANYDNCWSNKDVTDFIHLENGDTVYIHFTSNIAN